MNSAITLHPYQRKAVAAVMEAWQENRSALVVMATGLGKTIVFSSILQRRMTEGRSMVLAHREELIHQACQKIQWVTSVAPDIEMAGLWADQSWHAWHSPIVVSSIQTQNSGRGGAGRMTRFDPQKFATVVVDECHHATSPTYRRVMDHYKANVSLKTLGVTATPNRHDEEALGQIFDTCAFNYGIVDGIADGWLSPIKSFTMPIEELDISGVHTTAGDLNGAELAREMEKERPLLGLANAIHREAQGRKTLIFAASVEHARLLCAIFNTDYQDGCARFVSGKTPKEERRELLRAYANREYQFLVNCAVLGEGFDDPGIEVVVPRPTKSTPAYMQMIGRATRTLPGVIDGREWDDDQKELGIEGEHECASLRRKLIAESAKPHCEILDLYCQSGRHKLITATDVLGGNYSDEVLERAEKLAREDGKADDPEARLKRAQEQLHSEAKQKLARAAIQTNARYRKIQTDPFGMCGIEPSREPGYMRGKRPTEKMMALLRKQGIDPDGLSMHQAGQLIGEIKRRWDEKLVSPKQSKILIQFGFHGDMKREVAKPIIDTIFANNFRRVPDLQKWNPDGSPRA